MGEMTNRVVTVDVGATLAPKPTPPKIAIVLNRSPRWCAGFLRRKGHEDWFVQPFLIVLRDPIPDWSRATHERLLRPLAVTNQSQIRSCANQHFCRSGLGLESVGYIIIYDETGSYPDLPYRLDRTNLIFEQAKEIADMYSLSYGHNPTLRWDEWSANSREDFWDMAQDDMQIKEEDKIPLPDEFAT